MHNRTRSFIAVAIATFGVATFAAPAAIAAPASKPNEVSSSMGAPKPKVTQNFTGDCINGTYLGGDFGSSKIGYNAGVFTVSLNLKGLHPDHAYTVRFEQDYLNGDAINGCQHVPLATVNPTARGTLKYSVQTSVFYLSISRAYRVWLVDNVTGEVISSKVMYL